jgi:flagellar basal body-associated protein FliL
MAEEEDQAAEGEEGEAPPEEEPSSRLPQFIVLIFVILLGQGAAGYYLITEVYYPGLIDEPEEEGKEARVRERPVFEIDDPQLIELDEMVMNPPDNEGIRFLTAKVTIEVDSEEAKMVFTDPLAAAQLHDLVFGLLTTTEFKAMDEAEDRQKVKVRLKDEINGSPLLEETGEVTNVYFERFVLQ